MKDRYAVYDVGLKTPVLVDRLSSEMQAANLVRDGKYLIAIDLETLKGVEPAERR